MEETSAFEREDRSKGASVKEALMRLKFAGISILMCTVTGIQSQQTVAHRPPAVPLVANDPYFSLWSMADKLTDVPVKHWSEAVQPMTGLARIDGHNYRWMGVEQRQPQALSS